MALFIEEGNTNITVSYPSTLFSPASSEDWNEMFHPFTEGQVKVTLFSIGVLKALDWMAFMPFFKEKLGSYQF